MAFYSSNLRSKSYSMLARSSVQSNLSIPFQPSIPHPFGYQTTRKRCEISCSWFSKNSGAMPLWDLEIGRAVHWRRSLVCTPVTRQQVAKTNPTHLSRSSGVVGCITGLLRYRSTWAMGCFGALFLLKKTRRVTCS